MMGEYWRIDPIGTRDVGRVVICFEAEMRIGFSFGFVIELKVERAERIGQIEKVGKVARPGKEVSHSVMTWTALV
jgi:hypothetical protein